MMPPTRIEQLNNFQDAVQSPDGLDRLRALQAVEQALPSSQGLMGMPQVQAPMPMVPRQYGGEVGTGGLVEVLDDGTQVFDKTQEGILNRSIHGGILQGQTATAPSSFSSGTNASGTLAAGGDTGASTGLRPPTSNYNYLDIPDTLYPASRGAQTTQRMPDGTIPFDLYTSKMPVTFGQGFDLKDVPYLTANRMAQDAGADRFVYNEQYAGTADLPDDYDVGILGTQVYRDDQLDRVNYTGTQMGQGPGPVGLASNPNSEFAMKAKGYTRNPYTQQFEYSPNNTLNARVAARSVPTQAGVMAQYKHGGQITSKQYGGEIGTGGLLEVLDDGTQVFSNTDEGILNRSIHGGMLQGQTQTATASNSSSFSGGPTAAGTLASGTTAPSGFTIETGQDKYGNTIGDLTGMQDYYDLNFAARDAGQDTFMYGDKLMQVDPGYLRGGGINPFISNRLPAGLQQEVIDRPDLFRNINNLNTITKIQGDPTDPGFYSEAPYLPTQDFSKDISRQYNSYYEANQAAKEAGSPTFMWADKLAKTDPGLLPDYNYYKEGPKPFISNAIPEKYITAGVNLPPGWRNMSAQQLAKNQKQPYVGATAGMYSSREHGGQIIKREGGGQVDPSQAAQGLASFGRYGDNILVHMNPEELQGLASLGQITYNPVTGLPEAFSLKGLFKGIRKLAPIALAIAAPYAFGVAGATGLAGALKIGAATAFGSGLGNLIAGAKPGDALKAGLMSGLMAGGGAYLSGMGSAAAAGAGNVAGNVASGGTGAAGYGASLGAGAGGASTAGTSALSAGLGIPSSMGVGGFGQAIGAGGSLTPAVAASEFTTGLAGRAITPPTTTTPPIQLAQAPVNVDPNIGNPMIARNITPVSDFAPQQVTYAPGEFGKTNLPETNQIQGPPENVPSKSIFTEGGLSKENLSKMGSEIYDKYSTKEGIAKLIGMDLATPDYDIMYANEARAKEQELRDAGYTVETDFNKQTVIRDSKGVIQPRNLTASMLLDQALGKAPRTNLVARYGYGPKKEGGLISLKHGGEFSGMVPGDGHGMEDNVYMPITEGKKQVGTLAVSPSEYVVDSYTMAALGNGNADAGAKVMDRVVKHVRKKAYGDTEQPNEISGLQALKPMMERV